jgi:FtsP/CotA-like multicopper oxidase with cupredoxin domain
MHRFLLLAFLVATARPAPSKMPHGDDGSLGGRALPERIATNDNRIAAGTLSADTLRLRLVAREGRWFPQADSGPSTVVQAFAEEGHPLQIPGPLIRVRSGTLIRLSVRNSLGSTLVLFGMHERPGAPTRTLRVLAGGHAELRFRAGAPGTYFYWGSTTGNGMRERDGIDSQLYGAFVVDSANAVRPPRDRIFVMGVLHEPPAPPPRAMVINGKSWPYTERLEYQVGDTIRWRWLNASSQPHPMHLHGFYFNVASRGAWAADTVYTAEDRRLAVTEMMYPGGTMSMSWTPAQAGNWLFHCHFGMHVSHYLSMTDLPPDKEPDAPAEVDHSAAGMAGLVLGIVVREKPGSARTTATTGAGSEVRPRDIRLFMQASPAFSPPGSGVTLHNYAFVEQRGTAAPAPDSVPARSVPLVLRRGEPVRITIENRMPYPGAVHWHGIEVQNSYVDGVPGWSGSAPHLAPMVMPGDSFVAEFTPPRAGTFIYHSHSNEYFQITAGLAAPLIVLEPGAVYDTLTDRTILVNEGLDGRGRINGVAAPDTMHLVSGTEYRLRLIDIAPDWRVFVSLADAAGPLRWRAIAKDGADLPLHQRSIQSARVPMGPGETADFAYTPSAPGDLILEVSTQVDGWSIRVPVRVTSNDSPPARRPRD